MASLLEMGLSEGCELWLIELNKTKDESRKIDAYNAEKIKECGLRKG
jgi:hypothetical protein